MLDRLVKTSNKSKFPISNIFNKKYFKVFRLKYNVASADLLRKLGVDIGIKDLVGQGELAVLKKLGNKSKLGNSDAEKIAKIFKRKMLKNTKLPQAIKLVKLLNQMAATSGNVIKTETIAKMMFLVHDSDFKPLAKLLTKS